MPFSGLLELLGASTIICVLLAGLWKADDLFSPEFRDDVAIRILLLKPSGDMTAIWIAHVKNITYQLFGGKYAFIKILLISPFVTVILSISLFLILVPSRFSDGFADDFISVLILNVPMDIMSLVISVVLIHYLNRRNFMRILVLDVALSGAVYFLWTYTVSKLFIGQVENWFGLLTAKMVSIAGNPFSAINFLLTGSIETHGTWPYNSLIYFISNFSTSVLVWVCILGILSLKFAHKSTVVIPTLQYILPIEQRPFRSIGIVGVFTALLILSSMALLLFVWSVLT